MPVVKLDTTGKDYRVEVTVLTMVIYEQEFSKDNHHADIIGDTIGKVQFADSVQEAVTADFVAARMQQQMKDGKTLPKTTRELIERAFPAYIQTYVDYSATNWTQYLKCLWAMLRTADELEPNPLKAQVPTSYAEWVRSAGALDMDKVRTTINEVFIPACFPAER